MSLRLLTTRLIKNGRQILQSYWKREIHTKILEQRQNNSRQIRPRAETAPDAIRNFKNNSTRCAVRSIIGQTKNTQSIRLADARSAIPETGIFRFGQHARKLFIDNILNRVTSTYSKELRHQATRRLFYGDSAPFFALVGCSLASGAGVLTKEDELEGVCWEIREAVTRLQSYWNPYDESPQMDSGFNLDKLNIGPPIAKGCAAVVYAASLKTNSFENKLAEVGVEENFVPGSVRIGDLRPAIVPESQLRSEKTQFRPEMMTPIQNISRFLHNFGGSVDNIRAPSRNSATEFFINVYDNKRETDALKSNESEEEKFNAKSNENISDRSNVTVESFDSSIERYPLALKMMFNYDIQSNAIAILKAMYKETVPAQQRFHNESLPNWERLLQEQTLVLPPHPNIVSMFGFFCDEVRSFPDGHILYPVAQPQRINPHGYGRNMSLFLLMKRYDYSLRDLLHRNNERMSARSRLLLFTQLLEAVTHINRHGIAHRDIKSDNILVEVHDDQNPPNLVLSDFGCCLADKLHGLQVPYTSYDIDKGGNAALMAPEIINKQPGPFAVLNYGKSDLWACGAIAYEIFGLENPFYSTNDTNNSNMVLRNSEYKEEDLPPMSDDCPILVQKLIRNILNPNPSKRVSPDIASNVMQLYLWAPSSWIKASISPSSPEILQWLLSLTTKVICEGRNINGNQLVNYNGTGRRTYVEYMLIGSFLARARLRRIRSALNWIQDVGATEI